MKVLDIIKLEADNKSSINLVRDRLFWQAWEVSACLFTRHIRTYKVHRKNFRNVGMELVYLGFPRTALEDVIKQAIECGYCLGKKDDDHVILDGFPEVADLKQWKENAGAKEEQAASENSGDKGAVFLPIYQEVYGLTLEIFQVSSRVNKDYKYGLGEKLRNECSEALKHIHLMVNNLGPTAINESLGAISRSLETVRLYARVLKDMHQVNIKRFIAINKRLEEIFTQMRKWEHKLIQSA